MSKRIVMNLLADRPIAYHPDIARVAGGVKAGIFLSQLLYWSDKGKRGDGYIWKTQEELEDETALTRREQESARKILKSKGLIDEKLQGIPAKLYYKINTDILYDLLDALYVQASMHESAIQDATEAPNSDAPKRQSITESTSESTQENTTDNDVVDVDVDFGEVSTSYMSNIGMLNQIIGDNLKEAYDEYGKEWLLDAIREAAERNVLKWKYIDTILTNWKNEGRKKKDEPQEQRTVPKTQWDASKNAYAVVQ